MASSIPLPPNHIDDPGFIPGTVHLVDLDGTMQDMHAGGRQRDIVLVPAPSLSPDDPLNWSLVRKWAFLACLAAYVLSVGIASAAIYSVLVPISDATGLSVNTLNTGTGYMFLSFGWGCLFWQPLAQYLGKRPVYLISLLGTVAVMIWAPHAKTNGQWIASKVVQGFVGAPIESLCEISIADVFFAHERGAYMGMYALLLVGGNFLAPLMMGFVAEGQSWEWVLHWCAIFAGGAFLIDLFFMEETNFHRDGLMPATAAVVAVSASAHSDSEAGAGADPEKNAGSGGHSGVSVQSTDAPVFTRKTYLQRMRLWSSEALARKPDWKGMVTRPLRYVCFPVVVFCGFMYGSAVCYFNVLNGTASVIFSSPPYNFSSGIVGVTYVATILGVFCGAFYSGPLSDRFVLWRARRNGGILEAEYRLWFYSALLILMPFGLILWGVGAGHQVHWFGLVFSMFIMAGCVGAGSQLPISYCIDSYKDLGADAIVTVILIRNSMSFGISYGITPWVDNMGYQNAFIVAAMAALAQMSIFLVMIKYGRRLRIASTPRYRKFVKQVRDAGLAH